MYAYGADMRSSGFDQIIQSTLRRVWQHSALPGSHGEAEADPLSCISSRFSMPW